MLHQPFAHLGMLVGRAVVDDGVHRLAFRDLHLDGAELLVGCQGARREKPLTDSALAVQTSGSRIISRPTRNPTSVRSVDDRIAALLVRGVHRAWGGRQLQNSRALAFAQPGKQHDLPVGELQRIVMRSGLALVWNRANSRRRMWIAMRSSHQRSCAIEGRYDGLASDWRRLE
jgi:hypothetical protein